MEIFFGWESEQRGADAEDVPVNAWQGVEGMPSLRACSACAGDYEDPERTAAGEEDAERDTDEEADGDERLVHNDFPVRPE